MNQYSILKRLSAALVGASLMGAISLKASPVTVAEVGIGANETVYIDSSSLGNNQHVYAGVVDLLVNGIATNGFCIDPWHWSVSGNLPYTMESLDLAPKPPGPMGPAAALQIEQLWAQFYSPSISNIVAAAMQIEIWQIVDAAVSGGTFHLDSVDHDSVAVYAELATMASFLSSANGSTAVADLVAVSSGTGPGQDYVIQRVPDAGATVALLGLGLLGILGFRKKLRA